MESISKFIANANRLRLEIDNAETNIKEFEKILLRSKDSYEQTLIHLWRELVEWKKKFDREQ